MIRCANFLNLEGRRETVAKSQKYQPENDRVPYDLTDNNICMECEFGIEEVALILQAVKAASGDLGARVVRQIRELTGRPVQRVCFKKIEQVEKR